MHTFSIPEWHALALEGTACPARILIHGNSMYPLIRINRDYVTICPLKEKPEEGDIVLFADPDRKRYVLHRVWQTEDDRVLTWGDNCLRPDGWIPLEMVWGKAALIERGKRTFVPERQSGMRLARFWHRFGRVWRLMNRVLRTVRNGISRLFSRTEG